MADVAVACEHGELAERISKDNDNGDTVKFISGEQKNATPICYLPSEQHRAEHEQHDLVERDSRDEESAKKISMKNSMRVARARINIREINFHFASHECHIFTLRRVHARVAHAGAKVPAEKQWATQCRAKKQSQQIPHYSSSNILFPFFSVHFCGSFFIFRWRE